MKKSLWVVLDKDSDIVRIMKKVKHTKKEDEKFLRKYKKWCKQKWPERDP